jgi:hypothetical protein
MNSARFAASGEDESVAEHEQEAGGATMPLRDHFHAPLSELRHWESFHARWAAAIADLLEGELLPPGYFAEVQVHVGSRVEVDVATFDDSSASGRRPADDAGTAVATATPRTRTWAPPAPQLTMPAVFPDRLEVLIYDTEAGPTLVAAIELVSPRNKDRAESRRDFAIKCANYLRLGVSLIIVDIVTNRRANLHNELADLLGLPDHDHLDANPLYAIAYRVVRREGNGRIEVWFEALEVGRPLAMLPLPLDKGQWIQLDLEQTYTRACERMRLPAA